LVENNAFYHYGGEIRVIYESINNLLLVTKGGQGGVGFIKVIDPTTEEEITDLVIDDPITTISSYAFWGCKWLTSVTIPNSVTSIGGNSFYRCYSLSSLIIPTSVVNIGSNAFNNCTSLEEITYLGTIEQWGDININSNWLQYQGAVKAIHCTDGVIEL
jgi:hypothetical protein